MQGGGGAFVVSSGVGLSIQGAIAASSPAVNIRSYSSSPGIQIVGGGTGVGVSISGGTASGTGMTITATSGIGLAIQGGGASPAMLCTAGATAAAMQLVGGSTSGDGLFIQTTSGHGIDIRALSPTGGSGHGISIIGNTTSGNLGLNITAQGNNTAVSFTGGTTGGNALTLSTNAASGLGFAINVTGNLQTNFLPVVRNGTCQAGSTANTVVLDANASSTNAYSDNVVVINGGTGAGQSRSIQTYNPATKTATIFPNWSVIPDTTSTFLLVAQGQVDVGNWVNTTVPVPATAGIPDVNVLNWGNTVAPAFPANFSILAIDGSGFVSTNNSSGGGAGTSAEWNFNTGTASADPGKGKFRFNAVTDAAVTQLYFDSITTNNFDFSNYFRSFTSGMGIVIQDSGNASNWAKYTMSGAPLDQGGWWIVPVTFVSSGGSLPNNNSPCTFLFQPAAATSNVNVVSWNGTSVFGSVPPDSILTHNGLAQGGSTSTITLDGGASATPGFYTGEVVLLRSGTGAGQSQVISAYNGTTKVATVGGTWATPPDNTSVFSILPTGGGGAGGGGGPVGPGGSPCTFHVQDNAGNPVQGVNVWVSTDQPGNNVIAGTLQTDTFGNVTFLLQPGPYYSWVDKPQYTEVNPTPITVT
jgi:hypothetical protein